jgi:hypothetical protein
MNNQLVAVLAILASIALAMTIVILTLQALAATPTPSPTPHPYPSTVIRQSVRGIPMSTQTPASRNRGM